ncbi:MAG: acyl carrier protein [Clostridia bacterium]|nr:acyl carrier protein [Clostridia bacterium]
MEITKMSKDEVIEKVKEIVSNIIDIDKEEIDNKTKIINDLGVDSIDLMALVSKIQKETNIKFSIAKLIQDATAAANNNEDITPEDLIKCLEDVLSSKMTQEELDFIRSLYQKSSQITSSETSKIIAELLTIERIAEQIIVLADKDEKKVNPNEG